MENLTSSPVLSAPAPHLKVDGRDRPEADLNVCNVVVTEDYEGMARCELTLANWGGPEEGGDFLYFARDTFDFGKSLQVRLGDGDAAGDVFEGVITALEAHFFGDERSPEILVFAEDKLQNLRMVRRTRTFEDVSDADVFRRIASDHGMQSVLDLDGPSSHKVLAQVNQSDLAFLRERGRAIGAEVWVAGGTLHAQARSRRSAGEVAFTYGMRLREASIRADLSGQCSAFKVSGWDVSSKEASGGEATRNDIQSELGSGQTCGSEILENAIAARKQSLVHALPVSDEEARCLARSHYLLAARRFLSGSALVEGDGRVRAGGYVDLSGLGPLFNGTYYVVEAKHAFGRLMGYRCYLRVERPGLGS